MLSVEDKSDEFYTKAHQAFKQGRDMPSHLRISDYALQETPSEIMNAGIILRPVQLDGAGSLCWLEKMYHLGILAGDMEVGKTYQLIVANNIADRCCRSDRCVENQHC